MTIEAAPAPTCSPTCTLAVHHEGPCNARSWDLSSYSDRQLLESATRDAREARLVTDFIREQAPGLLAMVSKGPLGFLGSMFGGS